MMFAYLGTAMALNGNGSVKVLEPVADSIIMTANGRKAVKLGRDFVIATDSHLYVCTKTQFPALYWNWKPADGKFPGSVNSSWLDMLDGKDTKLDN